MIISDFQKQVDTLKSYGQDGYGENFPAPNPPKGGDSYDFPSESELLSDAQVDDWFLFLGAWKAYTSYKIGKLEAELFILSEGFDLMLFENGAQLEASSPKKLLKDSIKGMVLANDTELQNLKMKIMLLSGELKILRGRLFLYDGQFETISRIVTRRGQERFRT